MAIILLLKQVLCSQCVVVLQYWFVFSIGMLKDQRSAGLHSCLAMQFLHGTQPLHARLMGFSWNQHCSSIGACILSWEGTQEESRSCCTGVVAIATNSPLSQNSYLWRTQLVHVLQYKQYYKRLFSREDLRVLDNYCVCCNCYGLAIMIFQLCSSERDERRVIPCFQ